MCLSLEIRWNSWSYSLFNSYKSYFLKIVIDYQKMLEKRRLVLYPHTLHISSGYRNSLWWMFLFIECAKTRQKWKVICVCYRSLRDFPPNFLFPLPIMNSEKGRKLWFFSHGVLKPKVTRRRKEQKFCGFVRMVRTCCLANSLLKPVSSLGWSRELYTTNQM